MNNINSDLLEQANEDIILKESDLTFTVSSEIHGGGRDQTFNFYFRLQDGLPIKLGDGSYSAVFEVMGAGNKPYAVKILYEGLGKLAERRFLKEAKAISTIRQVVGEVSSIIQPVGYTEKFDESPAYKKFVNSSRFARLGLKLSKYALVTERYHGTLKDLLEKPAPLAKEKEVKPEYRERPGYEVLAMLDFKYRINTILPILRSIAQGLVEIHKAGYFHLDLKPANIYYRLTVNEFDVIIGDLGFIGQPEISGSAMTKEEVAFGTRHYRSPEQKDFFDICEVEVLAADAESQKKGEYRLVVRDPKFRDTIIEKGDNLMFSKDVHVKKDQEIMHHHEILDIEWVADNRAIIKIRSKHEIVPDKCTQIILYKQQATRTDLFGFGAVLFDMLTCGRSPERFYGYLSSEDRPNAGVGEIMEQYQRVASYSGEDPKYHGVFEAFLDKRTQDYAPLEVVEIILKSMLYRTEGTFFNKPETDQNMGEWSANAEPVSAAIQNLNDLQKRGYNGILVNRENPLTGGLREESQQPDRGDLQKEIDELQSLPVSKLLRRIGHAAIRFNQLLELVDVSLKGGSSFFAELNPGNVRIREKISSIYPKYKHREDYLIDLRMDRVYTKVLHNAMDPYSPEEAIGYMRREIELNRGAGGQNSTTEVWQYRFLDASPLGDDVSPSDWVLLPGNELMEIVDIHGDSLEIRKAQIDAGSSEQISNDTHHKEKKISDSKEYDKSIKAVYYRNLDPLKYYTIVLGTYLYHFFFVGLQSNGRSEPLSLRSLRAQIKSSPSLRASLQKRVADAISKPAFKRGISETQLTSRLYRRLTALYIALALYDLNLGTDVIGATDSISDSTMEGGDAEAHFRWFDVLKDIADCLKKNPGHLMSEAHLPEIQKIKDFEQEGSAPRLNVTEHICSILMDKVDVTNILKNKVDIVGSWMEARNWFTQKLKRG